MWRGEGGGEEMGLMGGRVCLGGKICRFYTFIILILFLYFFGGGCFLCLFTKNTLLSRIPLAIYIRVDEWEESLLGSLLNTRHHDPLFI